MSKLELNPLEKISNGMTRRDALRLMGLSPIAASVLASSAVTTSASASDAKGKIVIVGGGAGGIMAMARLRRALSNADITIIAPNEVHIYQPGQVFVAAGEYAPEDIIGSNLDLIPDDVKWIKDEVATFDPDNNTLITRKGEKVTYDYLVVATGLTYHYDHIEGLTADMIGKNGISSVYLNDPEKGTADGGPITWKWFNDLKEAAKTGKPRVICTQPATPIKCGGAPQKILYLSDDYLKEAGLTADFTFALNGDKLFGVPAVNETLNKVVQPRYGNITNKFKHNLVAIDAEKKIATFETKVETKGAYDEDLEEYEVITTIERVPMEYDFIHIVPPMSAPDAVMNSPLAWQQGNAKGWLEVDPETLQHNRYPNVFGIGDVCGTPLGKTGGTARHHAPIMVANLIAQMEKKALTEKFDGYTVCPLKTQYGKIILAEFNYLGAAPSFPLAVGEERWIWWAFDLYMLKPMYWHLMMKGLM
ncbi:MAG: NAD(P)/FAD-dependent oxidoreductase [Sulfuricurvum sp.]|jgi:sulfide:quinone oxidoreductase|uniref:NAD(P)/FAD-dependent oxidoreductase n=1 Tax=Sulfuricurvum sp. TaxID=2025608 RepID=UPI0025F9BBD9|nr:FAD/NAD(P)-binding oxidoreductase [Sulfuricurvum sp.]MCI4406689.1 NAD(P)/FAD-dependent oxidoreductase [Sulfuricurvum sp.]